MVQTSLIPTVISLSEFFAQNFPHIFWYPYWYMGVPFQYLIGPVVPVLLLLINDFGLKITEGYILLLALSMLTSSVGVYFLARSFGKARGLAFLASVIFLFMPFVYFLLSFQDGLNNVAFSLVPLIFVFYKKILEGKNKNWILLSILISLVLLINVSTVLIIIIGFLSLYFVVKGKELDEEQVFKTILSVLLATLIATIWYTPEFWLVNLTNPSIGGIALINLLASLFNFLFNFVPIVLVVIFFRWRKYKPKDKFLLFSSIIFFSYFFLSIVRFVGNPAFIQDWTSYGFELGFSLSLIASYLLFKLKGKPLFTVSLFLVGLMVLLSYFSLVNLFKQSYQYQTKISVWLSDVPKNERAFLSGSSVFWANSRLDIMQVRGGADSASLSKTWADGAYQIREGEDVNLTNDWLSILGANYILVNNSTSQEYYRDFKTPEKFSFLPVVKSSSGDTFYKVPNVWIARVVRIGLLEVPQYINGADLNSLSTYKSLILRKADFSYENPQTIKVGANLNKNEMISLAVSYSPNFKITRGNGQLTQDSYGNMGITAANTGPNNFEITYEPNIFDYLMPFILSLLVLALIKYYEKIFPRFKGKVNLHIGIFEEEDY